MESFKECNYTKCLMRTDKEFEVCPVEAGKREYEARMAAEEAKKNQNT